jgi:hypothetical protein
MHLKQLYQSDPKLVRDFLKKVMKMFKITNWNDIGLRDEIELAESSSTGGNTD